MREAEKNKIVGICLVDIFAVMYQIKQGLHVLVQVFGRKFS